MIVVTHKPQLLAHVDKVLVMSFGMTLAFGPRDAVIQAMRGQHLKVAASNDKPAVAQAAAPAAAAPTVVKAQGAA